MFKDEIQESNYHISHPLIRKNSVEFRTYQSNISQSAFNRNTLVILPTALGKTIISLLVCANTLYNYKDKRVLIMAPTRPLVIQHMNSFFSVLKMLKIKLQQLQERSFPTQEEQYGINQKSDLFLQHRKLSKMTSKKIGYH